MVYVCHTPQIVCAPLPHHLSLLSDNNKKESKLTNNKSRHDVYSQQSFNKFIVWWSFVVARPCDEWMLKKILYLKLYNVVVSGAASHGGTSGVPTEKNKCSASRKKKNNNTSQKKPLIAIEKQCESTNYIYICGKYRGTVFARLIRIVLIWHRITESRWKMMMTLERQVKLGNFLMRHTGHNIALYGTPYIYI